MLYAVLSIACFCLQSVSNKEYARRFPDGLAGMTLYYAAAFAVTTALCALFGGLAAPSPALLALSALFGVLIVFAMMTSVLAMKLGPMGATSLMVQMGMLLPVAAGVLFLGEKMTLLKGLGILFIIAALAISSLGGPSGRRGAARWLVLALLALLLNGALCIIQRVMPLLCPGEETAAFCFWCFAMATVASVLLFFVLRPRREALSPWLNALPTLGLDALALGVTTAGGNLLSMRAVLAVPAMVLNPLTSCGVVLLLYVFSALFYKEKIDRRGAVMLLTGVAGIVLLGV